MRRRSCVLCGRTVVANNIKRTTSNKKTNLIIASSLSLIGTVDRASTDKVVEDISNPNKYICQSHVVQAAQYLSGEMAATGRKFSYYDYPSARGKIAYVHTLDIPPHLVDVINGMSKSSVTATARDVLSFMNSALKKYYGTSVWPYQYHEEVLRDSLTSDDAGETAASFEADDEVKESVEDDAETDEGGSRNGDEASSGLGKVFGHEPDPTTLRRYYIVQGEMLMKLFRFCPECGHQLGKTQLKAVGTAAVVRFMCVKCTPNPPVRRWESQGRTVARSRERTYRGNVMTLVSTITNGLRYLELARWAEQTNLSIFSRTFFWNFFEDIKLYNSLYESDSHDLIV